MKKQLLYLSSSLLVIILVGALYILVRRSRTGPETKNSASAAQTVVKTSEMVAAPGRIEPISEEIQVSAEIPGKIAVLNIDEGDRIERGGVIAVLENSDYMARVKAAEAVLAQKEASLRRVINGARQQERREAQIAIDEAKAMMENAQLELDRRRALFGTGDISREAFERAERELVVTQSRYAAARERYSLIVSEPREEDRANAEAEVRQSRARLDEARAILEKTTVRAPIGGIITRKPVRIGEMVGPSLNGVSLSIVTIADTSKLRVRAEIDEADINKIAVGQEAFIKASAYGDKKIWGRVVRIGQAIGNKSIRTEKAAERVDKKVLETLIELDPGASIPIGLRVDTYILRGTRSRSMAVVKE